MELSRSASIVRCSPDFFLGAALLPQNGLPPADPIPVRHMEGSVHGFLAVRTTEDKLLAEGDLVQVTTGDQVTSELVFHFKDGSVDSDTAVFFQQHQRLCRASDGPLEGQR
jgi:hypothetical protein